MADFYGTVEGATAYHTARDNAAWSAAGVTDALRTASLVRASSWIDATYGNRFPGKKTEGRAQDLAWPRTGATDAEGEEIADDEIPREIEQATFEAALRELATPGSLSPDYVASERVKQEKVGELAVTYADGAGSADDVKPVISIIDGILSSLLFSPKSTTTLFGFVARA